MKTCDVSHQIIESVTCNTSCAVKVDSVKALHNICMIRNFEIRNNRLTEFLDLYVFAVIFTDRYRWINDVRDNHHVLEKFFFYFFFSCGKFLNASSGSSYLFLNFFCFFSLALSHKSTNLFGNFVSLCTKSFYFLFDLSVLFVQFQNFVY